MVEEIQRQRRFSELEKEIIETLDKDVFVFDDIEVSLEYGRNVYGEVIINQQVLYKKGDVQGMTSFVKDPSKGYYALRDKYRSMREEALEEVKDNNNGYSSAPKCKRVPIWTL